VLYGRYVRKLSKRTQRALGELTKVSEERLGNIRTAQAFNGEIQEVDRYNKKIRDLFELGKKEVLTLNLSQLIIGPGECVLFLWVWVGREYDGVDGPCDRRANGCFRIYYDRGSQLILTLYDLRWEQYFGAFFVL